MIQQWEGQAAGSPDKRCMSTVGRVEVPQHYWTLPILPVTPLISWSKSVLCKYTVLLWAVQWTFRPDTTPQILEMGQQGPWCLLCWLCCNWHLKSWPHLSLWCYCPWVTRVWFYLTHFQMVHISNSTGHLHHTKMIYFFLLPHGPSLSSGKGYYFTGFRQQWKERNAVHWCVQRNKGQWNQNRGKRQQCSSEFLQAI